MREKREIARYVPRAKREAAVAAADASIFNTNANESSQFEIQSCTTNFVPLSSTSINPALLPPPAPPPPATNNENISANANTSASSGRSKLGVEEHVAGQPSSLENLDQLPSALPPSPSSLPSPQTSSSTQMTSLPSLSSSSARILECSGFPREFKTEDLELLFKDARIRGRMWIKWIDDTICLLVFNSDADGKI